MNRRIRNVIFAVMLTAFTVYSVLDTFVISRAYAVVQTDQAAQTESVSADTSGTGSGGSETDAASGTSDAGSDTSEEDAGSASQEPVVTDTSYSDENITVTLSEYRENDTTIYVADVTLSSAEYLKTAFAQNIYGKNVTAKTSETASDADAILAINGDYYGARNSGYVIRNGVIYRSEGSSGNEDLVIYEDGSFGIISEDSVSAEELLADGAEQVLSFGPDLIEDGNISVSEGEEVGKAMASNPRTAIGIIDDLHYVFVVSDGRTSESEGLNLYELAGFMESLGVETAYNLDGGGSSTMYFLGSVVNNPTTNGRTIGERSVSDIVYIGN